MFKISVKLIAEYKTDITLLTNNRFIICVNNDSRLIKIPLKSNDLNSLIFSLLESNCCFLYITNIKFEKDIKKIIFAGNNFIWTSISNIRNSVSIAIKELKLNIFIFLFNSEFINLTITSNPLFNQEGHRVPLD